MFCNLSITKHNILEFYCKNRFPSKITLVFHGFDARHLRANFEGESMIFTDLLSRRLLASSKHDQLPDKNGKLDVINYT